MIFPLLLIMIGLLVWDHIQDGGSFIFFAKVMDWYNSFGKPRMSLAQKTDECVYIEYKAGKRTFGLMFPIRSKPLEWKVVVAADKNGTTSVVTDEFLHFGGPFRDFYGIPVKPSHFNSEYAKIMFVFGENDFVEVEANEIIIAKFKLRADGKKKN
jgi:hypothetical protein